MAYFAILQNNIVINVIKADLAFVQGLGVEFAETFKDRSQREKYAGKGYTFDDQLDAFITPKPFSKWTFDNQLKDWKAPKTKPNDDDYYWDDNEEEWIKSKVK